MWDLVVDRKEAGRNKSRQGLPACFSSQSRKKYFQNIPMEIMKAVGDAKTISAVSVVLLI